jgi:general nucleoside transport system permease protein
MSVATAPAVSATKSSWWSSVPRTRRKLYMAAAAFAVISIVRAISSENDLTSKFTISQTIISMLPILLAGLGGLLSERVGVLNIGLEGMLIAGCWGAGFFGYHWGPWAAVVGGMACGALGGLLHALATVTFGVDHVISGVAINALAFGWARFGASSLFKGRGSGSETNSPGFDTDMGALRVPGFGDGGFVNKLEDHHWPIVSDIAGVSRGLFAEIKVYQIIAAVMVPLVWYLVWKTPFGLRLRASGEKPSAPDSLGVNVVRTRYIALALGGAMAGLGGVLLVLNNNGSYVQDQQLNKGFLGLAALIFGNWRPGGLVAGAALFGFFDQLQLTAAGSVRALFLLGAIAAVVGAVVAWRRTKRLVVSIVLLGLAAGLFALFATKFKMPADLVKALPYFVTLVVLAVFSRRLRGPASAGMPWRKGQIG